MDTVQKPSDSKAIIIHVVDKIAGHYGMHVFIAVVLRVRSENLS
jgi:hypothetical protein